MEYSAKKIIFRIAIIVVMLSSIIGVYATYVPTNRDTREAPDEVTQFIDEPTDMQLLKETENFRYYFRESRDTIAIYDKRNEYTWLTGTDLEFSKDIDDECDDVLDLYEDQFYGLDPLFFNDFALLIGDTTTSYVVDNGSLSIALEGLLETDASDTVSVTLEDMDLNESTMYQLSFTASSRDDKNLIVNLGSEINEQIALTNEDTAYTFVFTASSTSTADIEFLLGNIDADYIDTKVFLDDIMFEEWDPTVLDTDGVTVIGGVIEDTNQVLRGDFELLEAELTTTDDDILNACRPKEVRLNTTYTGFANSLITVEFYDFANNIKRISSASHANVDSELLMVNGDDSHYRLDIDFKKENIEISVHIYFDNNGIRYEVRDEEVYSEDETYTLAAIIISPFLGASGGAYEEFDLTEMDYKDEEIFKYKVPGYSLVPDGSGTLIRFSDNDVKLEPYKGTIYGEDIGQASEFYNFGDGYVPHKKSSMPVFGMAHGDEQAAFIAYATSGEEHMQVIAMPEENLTYYNFTYPRFEYNKQYLQVYNKQGWGYLTYYEDRNHFDIEMRYDFLAGGGDTGHSADYVGMAGRYREYLIENELLNELEVTETDIPIRLDFLMSDSERSITGFVNQVTTKPSGVDSILESIMADGITNINSGLLGWNDGGVTIGDTRDVDFSRDIGRESEFEDLFEKYNELGVDISFQDDYFVINDDMMTLRRNAAQHTSTWYSYVDVYTDPIERFYFARPVKSMSWIENHAEAFNDLGVLSYSISGITDNLITDATDNHSRRDAMNIYLEGFSKLDQTKLINAYQPNMFLWQYTDRYLSAPVYGTQFLIETDTVPFLQLVLNNTMEMYAPYSNFSFYTQSDMLRMIDYNVYPSFVLTDNPAYLLTDTNSKNFYSTEYDLYQELIPSIYGYVNEALKYALGSDWVDRTVLENGVIRNTYSNGVEIIINYTEDNYDYDGVIISGESYEVVGE